MWVDLPRGTDVNALFEAAAESGVAFVKGSDFVLDGAESSLRLAYSGVTPDEIEEGVKRLSEAYRHWPAPAKMRPEEIAALGDLAGEAAAGAGRATPRDAHRDRRPSVEPGGTRRRSPAGSPTTGSRAARTRRRAT